MPPGCRHSLQGELVDFVVSFAAKESLKVGETVIGRDIDCLIRTYAVSSNGKKHLSPEAIAIAVSERFAY